MSKNVYISYVHKRKTMYVRSSYFPHHFQHVKMQIKSLEITKKKFSMNHDTHDGFFGKVNELGIHIINSLPLMGSNTLPFRILIWSCFFLFISLVSFYEFAVMILHFSRRATCISKMCFEKVVFLRKSDFFFVRIILAGEKIAVFICIAWKSRRVYNF